MADEAYRGWTNRETWCVHLWLTHDVTRYAGALAAAKAVATFHPENVENYARGVVDCQGIDGAGWDSDLVNYILARVNWREVSNALREG